jgi:hypothetical protein
MLILMSSQCQYILFTIRSKALGILAVLSLFVTFGHVIRTVHECGLSYEIVNWDPRSHRPHEGRIRGYVSRTGIFPGMLVPYRHVHG